MNINLYNSNTHGLFGTYKDYVPISFCVPCAYSCNSNKSYLFRGVKSPYLLSKNINEANKEVYLPKSCLFEYSYIEENFLDSTANEILEGLETNTIVSPFLKFTMEKEQEKHVFYSSFLLLSFDISSVSTPMVGDFYFSLCVKPKNINKIYDGIKHPVKNFKIPAKEFILFINKEKIFSGFEKFPNFIEAMQLLIKKIKDLGIEIKDISTETFLKQFRGQKETFEIPEFTSIKERTKYNGSLLKKILAKQQKELVDLPF